MCWLDLPLVDLAISTGEESPRYLTALRNYDRHDSLLHVAIWCRRFEQKS